MAETRVKGGVGAAIPHDSGHLHVSGEAVYTDDIPELRGTLYAAIGSSRSTSPGFAPRRALSR
jgi:xanthine dehydrogenase large subunit